VAALIETKAWRAVPSALLLTAELAGWTAAASLVAVLGMPDRPYGADGQSRSPQIGMTRNLIMRTGAQHWHDKPQLPTPMVIPPSKQRIFGDAGGLTALQCFLLSAAGSQQSPNEAPDAAQAGAADLGGRNRRDAGRRWAALPPSEGDTYSCEHGPVYLLTIAFGFVTPSGWLSSDDSCAMADGA
jgi:hypothetical protein